MSATINVSESDFDALAAGANYAMECCDKDTAIVLDRIARKANAALSHANLRKNPGFSHVTKQQRWKDVPSTLPAGKP